jgi:hypothetical protein
MNIIYDGFMNRVNYMIQETITVYWNSYVIGLER